MPSRADWRRVAEWTLRLLLVAILAIALWRSMRASRSGAVSVAAPGTFDVESDCIIRLEFTLPAIDGGAEIPLKLRGVLVNDGKEIFAIETSPHETLSVQLVSR